MLGHHWERAEATIVARTVRVQPAGHLPHHDFVVEVRPVGGPPVRLTIHDGPAGDIPDPSVGDVLGVLYDPKHQHVKWDLTDPWLLDSAADRRAGGNSFVISTSGPGIPPGAFGGGNVQYLSGEAASEMLGTLFGAGGAETIAAMRAARAGHEGAPAADPAERLARLQALRDRGLVTEAEYEAQRQKIIGAL